MNGGASVCSEEHRGSQRQVLPAPERTINAASAWHDRKRRFDRNTSCRLHSRRRGPAAARRPGCTRCFRPAPPLRRRSRRRARRSAADDHEGLLLGVAVLQRDVLRGVAEHDGGAAARRLPHLQRRAVRVLRGVADKTLIETDLSAFDQFRADSWLSYTHRSGVTLVKDSWSHSHLLSITPKISCSDSRASRRSAWGKYVPGEDTARFAFRPQTICLSARVVTTLYAPITSHPF